MECECWCPYCIRSKDQPSSRKAVLLQSSPPIQYGEQAFEDGKANDSRNMHQSYFGTNWLRYWHPIRQHRWKWPYWNRILLGNKFLRNRTALILIAAPFVAFTRTSNSSGSRAWSFSAMVGLWVQTHYRALLGEGQQACVGTKRFCLEWANVKIPSWIRRKERLRAAFNKIILISYPV